MTTTTNPLACDTCGRIEPDWPQRYDRDPAGEPDGYIAALRTSARCTDCCEQHGNPGPVASDRMTAD